MGKIVVLYKEPQRTPNSQSNLEKEEQSFMLYGGIMLPDFKL